MNINNAACGSISRSVRHTHTHTAKDKHINRQTERGRCERQLREGERETHWIREEEEEEEEMNAARNGKKAEKFRILLFQPPKTAEPSAITGWLGHESLSAVVCSLSLSLCAAAEVCGL